MNSPNVIDTWPEVSQLVAVSVVVLFAGALFGISYLQANPNALNKASSLFDEPNDFSGGNITFTGEQVDLLSKNYEESDQEFVYCMEVDGGSVESLEFSPNVTEKTRGSISYKCGSDMNGVVHSHPGPLGVPELSQVDKNTLSSSERLEVSCVVAGTIPDYEWQNPTGMNCFDKDFNRLNIRIN